MPEDGRRGASYELIERVTNSGAERLKILVYSPYFFPLEKGGAERSTRILCHDLAARGHHVTVVKVGPPDSPVSYVDRSVRVVTLPMRLGSLPVELASRSTPTRLLWHTLDIWDVPRMLGLSQILRDAHFDIFHSQSVTGLSAAGWRVASRAGAAVVHTTRDYNLLCPPGNLFRDGRRCLKRCGRCVALSEPKRLMERYVDHVVGISRHILDRHLTAGHFKHMDTTVIPNAVELPEPLSSKSGDKVAARGPRVGFLGSVSVKKGVQLLIREFRRVAGPEWELHIAGHVVETDRRTILAEAAGDHRVRFVGMVDPVEFLRPLSFLVVPSLWDEPMGRVVPEAFSTGTPVLGSLRGGIPEMVNPGVNGAIFEPDNPEELGLRLVEMATSHEKMQQACLTEAARYSRDRHVAAYEKTYEEALNARARSVRR